MDSFPVTVTIHSQFGLHVIFGVREDSIDLDHEGTFKAEGQDTRNPHLWTFKNVGGYSTRIQVTR